MKIYQVHEQENQWESSNVIFSTSDKELAEKYVARQIKFQDYCNSKVQTIQDLSDEIYDIVCRKIYNKSSEEHFEEYLENIKENETQEERKLREDQNELEWSKTLNILKTYPIDLRAYKTLGGYEKDSSFFIREIELSEELPKLFYQNDPEEFEDVLGDEAEFLEKDFERYCNGKL